MRKAVIPVLFLALSLAALPLSAQENKKKKAIDLEQEFFQLPDSVTNEWLDATSLPKKARINDTAASPSSTGISLRPARPVSNPTCRSGASPSPASRR